MGVRYSFYLTMGRVSVSQSPLLSFWSHCVAIPREQEIIWWCQVQEQYLNVTSRNGWKLGRCSHENALLAAIALSSQFLQRLLFCVILLKHNIGFLTHFTGVCIQVTAIQILFNMLTTKRVQVAGTCIQLNRSFSFTIFCIQLTKWRYSG